MNTADFNYHLPPELIAQQPLEKRSDARMLVLQRSDGSITHRNVRELPQLLRSGDILVVNDTRVIPARIFGRRADTGGRVEVLLVEQTGTNEWDAFYKASAPARQGQQALLADEHIRAEIIAVHGEGRVSLRLECSAPLPELLEIYGTPPLPPYIRRERGGKNTRRADDIIKYQTVYACNPGAVAAPTAGLHFTPQLLQELEAAGIMRTALTLHVGPGTFKPVKADRVEEHTMEAERYIVAAEAADAINRARADGGRVVAVGSTVVRTLETVYQRHGALVADSGKSDLFIHPPYQFKAVDIMLTNFHLPQSTLMMMICALAGREKVLAAYEEAVRLHYRFYSYGDCMLIL